MAKKKRTSITPRAKTLGKRAANYQHKLKTLRLILGGFDAKKFDGLQASKPKTARGQVIRRKAMQRVARTFERVRPYIYRDFKAIRIADKQNFESLRKYVGVPKFKRMRAVPMPTQAKKVTVRFDRDGLPLIREDGLGQKIFRFPHLPRPHNIIAEDGSRRFVDAEADAVAMFKDMLPKMPVGHYEFLSRHHFLIPFSADRESIEDEIRRFYDSYGESPEFLGTFFGFKFLTDSEERALEMIEEMKTERGRRARRRRHAQAAKAMKVIRAMDKQLKAGVPLTRGQQTQREKLRHVGESPWQREKREADERKARKRKTSKRARATGRR